MNYVTSLIALAFCLLVGCSREKAVETPKKAEVRVTTADFGVIEFSDGMVTLHDLGGGKTCRTTATFQRDGTVLLTAKIEQGGELLSAPRIQTPFDMPVAISVGDVGIRMTPRKKQ